MFDEINNIASVLQELKGHAIAGGTIMKIYADDIVADAYTDLKLLEIEADKNKYYTQLGMAVDKLINDKEARWRMADKTEYELDTIEDILAEAERLVKNEE